MVRLILKFGLALVLAAAAVCSRASELAVLRNGNSIHHERREIVGAVTRLYLTNSSSSSGYIEIPTDQIDHFETDADPPPAPATASTDQTLKIPQPVPPSSQLLNHPAQANLDRGSLDQMVNGAGQRHQIDPDFINSVIRAESGFNNRAVSKKGAQGLMQLMPRTASQLGVTNSFDPNSNVEGGTKYLRELLEKYNYDVPKALAAYNAGAGRVDKYRGVPPYFETQTYVAKIIRDFNRKKLAENPALAHKSKATRAQTAKAPQKTHAKTASSLPQTAESASR